MDSGSAVDTTPEDENPEFPIVELSGPRRGRKLCAASGSPIPISEEKWISCKTGEGWDLIWLFIAGEVENTLKSVGTTCDAKSYVRVDEDVGCNLHKSDDSYIEFGRVGDVYTIDM